MLTPILALPSLQFQNVMFWQDDNFFFQHCLLAVLQPKPADGPGENGKAVVIPKSQEAEMKEKFKINQFNLMASDLISVNRSLPDVRMDA